jgi:pyruvate kinase
MPYPNYELLKRRRTKIVATLGPASSEATAIDALIRAGVNVVRLNMSHGDHASHGLAYQRVREVAANLGAPVAVLADLCGPKIRVGEFAGGSIEIANGSRVVVTTREVVGAPGLIPSQYEALAKDVRPGDRILLDDGLFELRVDAVEDSDVTCTVVHGGTLKNRKGMNLPGVNVSAPTLTEKDCEDAQFMLALGVDFLALSFVRRAADIAKLRQLVEESDRPVQIIAKIELPEALERIEEILEAADGIMVARGDLGVELPPEVVPIAQRELVARARAKSKPAIVATQMLESMIEHPLPTRAEVSDVSNAVFSGADAVMLSAETASGLYPLRAVEMMDRIARQAEALQWSEGAFRAITEHTADYMPVPLHAAVARATAQLSRDLGVRAIVVLSRGGATATVVAAARPAAPVLAATPDAETARRMNLLWGVDPVQVEADELDHPRALTRRLAGAAGLANPGDFVLALSGFGGGPTRSAPTLTVVRV